MTTNPDSDYIDDSAHPDNEPNLLPEYNPDAGGSSPVAGEDSPLSAGPEEVSEDVTSHSEYSSLSAGPGEDANVSGMEDDRVSTSPFPDGDDEDEFYNDTETAFDEPTTESETPPAVNGIPPEDNPDFPDREQPFEERANLGDGDFAAGNSHPGEAVGDNSGGVEYPGNQDEFSDSTVADESSDDYVFSPSDDTNTDSDADSSATDNETNTNGSDETSETDEHDPEKDNEHGIKDILNSDVGDAVKKMFYKK